MRTRYTIFSLLLLLFAFACGTEVYAELTVSAKEHVYLCPNQAIDYRGIHITKPGVYYDTLYSVRGKKDSLIQIVVNTPPTFLQETYGTIIPDSTYVWGHNGQTYTTAGIYYDNQKTVLGCDSVFRLVLAWNADYLEEVDTVVCHGDLPFVWRKKQFYESTELTDISRGDGVDSVFVLHLKVQDRYETNDVVWMCNDAPFYYRGKPVMKGVVTDTLFSLLGCDSIVHTYINRAQSYYFRDTIQLTNQRGSITWQGDTYTTAGTYFKHFQTVHGCDSTYELTVCRNPVVSYRTDTSLCACNLPMQWRGGLYHTSGTYYDSVYVAGGVDTVFVLNLNVWEDYVFDRNVNVCESDVYTFRGRTIPVPGFYADSFKTVHGCDSVYRVFVNRAGEAATTIYEEICAGSYYDFHGQKLDSAGNYYDTIYTQMGCDSVVHLVLNIAPMPHHTVYGTFCPGEKYQFRGRKLETPGVYTDTLVSAQGCDSILTLVLNYGDAYYYYDTLHKGDIDTVMWRGQKIVAAGTYYDRQTSVTGCDSVTELEVILHSTYHFREEAVLCQNDSSYEWQGGRYSETGVFTVMYKSIYNTDSIYVLDLTVNPVVRTNKYFSICSGEGITYNGYKITEPTEFRDTLLTSTGCDSIVHVIVNRAQTYLFETDGSLHTNGKYEWRGETYTKAGVYYDSLLTVQHCDSVFKLTLHENPVYYFRKDTTICESELPYNFNDHRLLYNEGTFYDSLFTTVGADSVYELHLKVNHSYLYERTFRACLGTEIQYGDTVFRKNTIYYDSLLTIHGCDSVIKVIAVFTPSYTFSESKHICEGEMVTWRGMECDKTGVYADTLTSVIGCDSIFVLNLTVHKNFFDSTQARVCYNDLPYRWRGHQYYETGVYYDSLITRSHCDSVYMLDLNVNPRYEFVQYRDVCAGDFLIMGKDTIRTSRTIEKRYETVTGCDSIYRTIITVKSTDTIVQNRIICSNDTFSWRGQMLTRPNTYVDALPYSDARGLTCDSVVYILNLEVKEAFFENLDTLVCQDSLPFIWRERKFWNDTIVADTLVNSVKCDSIYQLQLKLAKCSEEDTLWLCPDGIVEIPSGQTYDTVGKFCVPIGQDSVYRFRILPADTFRTRLDTAVCSSRMPFRFHGLSIFSDEVEIGKPSIIDHTLTSIHGCDSVIELHLTVWGSDTITREMTLCHGEQYSFKGKKYTAPCVFYDTLLTANSVSTGCDSIVRYILNAYPSYAFDYYDTILEGETYKFKYADEVREIHYPGTHIFRDQKTIHGCDSVIRLHLALQNTAFVEDTVTICYDSDDFPFIHNRKEYRTSTLLKDTFHTEQGYDSIVWTHLVVHPRIPETRLVVNMCDGDEVQIHGKLINESCNIYDTLPSIITGCDSVIHYIVNKSQTYFFHQEATFCSNRSYQWKGHHNDISLRWQGIYYDSLLTTAGCDSIYELVLTSKPAFLLDTTIMVCYDELPYSHEGRLYYESRLFADTFHTADCGCDSIRRFQYILTNRCSETTTLYRCGDEPMRIGSQELYDRGSYRFPQWSETGLDSIFRFVLDTAQPSFHAVEAGICFGDSVLFEGRYYSKPGTYRANLTSVKGCDSIRELTLSFTTQPVIIRRAQTIADYQLPYLWRNSDYVRAGTYNDYAYNNVTGCVDTLYQLELEVLPTSYDTLKYSICRGDSILFAGQWYKSSILTADTLDYRRAGRSAITQLILHVQDSTRLESLTMYDDCADATEMRVALTYTGAAPEKYSVEFIGETARQVGFEDVIDEPYTGDIRIAIPQQKGDAYYIDPGEYRFRLSLGNRLCGSTSQEAVFTLKYPSWIMEQNWGNVVALLNSAYNGGYEFVGYKWTVLGRKNIVSTQPYLSSDYLEPGDSVIVSLSRDGEHYISSCPLIIREYTSSIHPYPILVYPTSAPRARSVVNLEAEMRGRCLVYNAEGQLCGETSFEEGKQTVALPPVSGCYMIVLRTADGYSVTRKILIY